MSPTTALALATTPAPAKSAQTAWSARQWIEHLRFAVGLGTAPVSGTGKEVGLAERVRLLADALLSERGEVLGTVIAHDLNHIIRSAKPHELLEFLNLVSQRYGPDEARLANAVDKWRAAPSQSTLAELTAAVEPPRQELFRRLNMAPGGTATLVGLRDLLLKNLGANPQFAPVDDDLKHLFASWFNRGFLTLRRIDWNTPASILEKLIAYEAVHAIAGWDDLRRRLAADRRCFAFFHPALPDDPLIFIEVALLDHLSQKIEPIIRAPMVAEQDFAKVAAPTTAVFYSISNCQPGLRGVSFGNFLIKQVAADLARELPSLTTFSTLSPIPSLRTWINDPATPLDQHVAPNVAQLVLSATHAPSLAQGIERLAASAEAKGFDNAKLLKDVLLRLGARYVAGAGLDRGPRDPVARFHLGNGARVERVNWMADMSAKGLRESYGLMVNYRYDLETIEANHEAFANRRPIATSEAVAELIGQTAPASRARTLMGQVDAAIGRRGS